MTALHSPPRPASHLEQYRGYFDQAASPFVEVATPLRTPPALGAPKHRRYHPHPQAGTGWIDMHEFGNGIAVSRLDCRLFGPRAERYQQFSASLRLNVVLQGEELLLDHHGQHIQGEVGDVVVRHGDPGPLDWRLPAGSQQVAVALELPAAMVQALAEQGADLAHFGQPGSCTMLRPRAELRRHLLAIAGHMLALPASVNLMAQLELESLALDLLLTLVRSGPEFRGALPAFLNGRAVAPRWQSAVDEAVDVLKAEWRQPITIAQLARRVGINECYLKELFRLRTGNTVAGYQRSLRMRHARGLIESGQYTVQQAALACGYARSDKFAQAFRREHGVLPSALR